jgi:hypothetical protein
MCIARIVQVDNRFQEQESHGPSRLAHRLIEAWRLLGWRMPLVSIQWLVRPSYFVMLRDLRLPIPSTTPRQPIHMTTLSEADIPAIGAIDPAMHRAEVERRLAEGQVCTLAWVGPDLAYYSWSTTRPIALAYLGMTLVLEPGQIFVDITYTAPRFRRLGMHHDLATLRLIDERSTGAITHLTLVAWWHRPSLRVFSRLGFTVAGTIGYWNLGRWRRHFPSGAVRLTGPTTFSIDAYGKERRI